MLALAIFITAFGGNFIGNDGLTTVAQIQPDNTFSNGERLSYRTLLVDTKSTSLYVGAKGNIFRLWLYNINDTVSSNLYSSRSLEVRSDEKDECLRAGNSERECDNWVRLIFLKANGQLLICTSNAMKPQMSTLDGVSLADTERPKTIIGICSPHENLNNTAVYSEFGNPDDLPSIYSGIRTGLSLENHLIYRPPLVFNNKEVHPSLRTIYTDSKWLNEPQFVGSFSINQYVYFFFREFAVKSESCGRNVYSRVARICKSDLGGKNVLRQVWSSFVKARLNCSIQHQHNSFYFDHIQSVYKLEEDRGDTHFYATFTTAESPFQASALCFFSLNSINQLFDNGLFLEQPSINSAWIPTQPDRLPSSNRPGTCVPDSRNLSDEELHFSKSHLLMAESVQAGPPIIYRKDELLTKLVADRRDERNTVVFVLFPHRNSILKILHPRSSPGRILAIYQMDSAPSNSIHQLAILPNEYLFIGQESRVSQFRLGQCSLHRQCHSCASDPYCSWNVARSECFSMETIHLTAVGWITNPDQADDKCGNYVKSIAKIIFPGDSVHLECPGLQKSSIEGHEWRVDRKPLPKTNNQHFVMATNGGIVLLNVTTSHSGTYQCVVGSSPVIEYTINVSDADCSRPKTLDQFHSAQREWCKKMGAYKSNLSRWESLYENNSHCPKQESSPKKSEELDDEAQQTFA